MHDTTPTDSSIPEWLHRWNAYNNHGTFCQLSDDFKEAHAAHSTALVIARHHAADDELFIAHSLTSLAACSLATHDLASATTHLTEALAIRKRLLPDWNPQIAEVIQLQASVSFARGNYTHARDLYIEAVRALYILPDAHPIKIHCAQQLLKCQDKIKVPDSPKCF